MIQKIFAPLFTVALTLGTLVTSVGFDRVALAAPAQVINIGNGAEPQSLDPHKTTGVPEDHILTNLFEALVSKDPKTLEPVPGIAEKWVPSKDKKTWTFTLRKDAKWSNGDPITAQDYVYSWTRLLDPATASEYAYQGWYIKNGKEFNSGKLKDASKLGVKAIDAHTLEVTLENPTPFFIQLLFHYSLYAVPKGAIEKYKDRWTRPENIVTSGAFKLAKWETNKVITLVKNPLYWDAARVTLTEANFFPTENLDTEEKMFRTKQLHVTNEVPLEKLPFWQKDKSGAFQSAPYLGSYYYNFNVTRPPLNDKRVRRALALAIDREKIVKYVAKGNQDPAGTLTPDGIGSGAGIYHPTPRLPLKLDAKTLAEAKKLLADAGYGPSKPLPAIEVLYNTHEGHKKIAEALQQMWKQNLGIEVKLYNQEWKVYLDSLHTMNYHAARRGWIADYNDPNTFLDLLVTNGGNNNTGWSNATYDKYIADAAKELDVKKRLAIFHKAEDLLLEELPILPIYIYKRNYLKSPMVAGWYSNIEDKHPLKYVSITAKP